MTEKQTILSDVKKLLSGSVDDKLEIIERKTRQRLQIKMRVPQIPENYEYIVSDITLKRFNRVGNEGMQSYSQEGLSISFPDSDFDEYEDEINSYIEDQNPSKRRKSAVRWI